MRAQIGYLPTADHFLFHVCDILIHKHKGLYNIKKKDTYIYIYIQHTMLEDAGVESEEELVVVVEQEGAGVVVVFIVILHEKMIS